MMCGKLPILFELLDAAKKPTAENISVMQVMRVHISDTVGISTWWMNGRMNPYSE